MVYINEKWGSRKINCTKKVNVIFQQTICFHSLTCEQIGDVKFVNPKHGNVFSVVHRNFFLLCMVFFEKFFFKAPF